MEHARRAFLRDYRVPHGPARTRTKNAIIAFACAPHRVFCKKVAITLEVLPAEDHSSTVFVAVLGGHLFAGGVGLNLSEGAVNQ